MLLEILLSIYLVGVLVGVAVMRDPWPARLGTAAVWPLGLASFFVVTLTLVAAALYLWPIALVALVPLAAALWLLF